MRFFSSVLLAGVVSLLLTPTLVFAQSGGTPATTQPEPATPTATPTQQEGGAQSAPAQAPPQTAPAAPTNPNPNKFVPLTSVPAFQDVAASNNISNFLNNLYKIAIGIAAVLAVLQITRAGIEYMGGDSITEKRHARDLLWKSLLGLLLVLSPVIVFSIIDPRIVSLQIDTTSLQPTARIDMSAAHNGTVAGTQQAVDNCRTRGGTPLFVSGSDQMACEIPAEGGVGAGTRVTEDGTTTNYQDLPVTVGHFIVVFLNLTQGEQPTCSALAYKTFADREVCQTALPSLRTGRDGWFRFASCEAVSSSKYRIQANWQPCPTVEVIP